MPTITKNATSTATVEDRKKQIAQLAEMGVVVPEEYRKEMAMTGEWQTVSRRIVKTQQGEDNEEEENEEDNKYVGLNIGVRKRKVDDDELQHESKEKRRPRWGTEVKSFAGNGEDDDLEALLGSTSSIKPKPEEQTELVLAEGAEREVKKGPEIKQEEILGEMLSTNSLSNKTTSEASVKEEESEDVSSMFKKRKSKPLRQR